MHDSAVSSACTFTSSLWVRSFGKRIFDLVITLLVLPVALPLMTLLALLVKVTSNGPVFHIQERLGIDGKPFFIFKFRTMKHGRLEPGPALTQLNDPRLTRAGAWLRQWKLDELPQIWNVLCGEMSWVGPRPHLPQLMRLHDEVTMQVLSGRPGVTGPSAIAFRHEEELLEPLASDDIEVFYMSEIQPSKFEMDLAYLRNATIATDIDVMVKTAFKIFSKPPE